MYHHNPWSQKYGHNAYHVSLCLSITYYEEPNKRIFKWQGKYVSVKTWLLFLSSWANLRYTYHPVISNMMEHYNPWCDKYVHSSYQGSHHISIHKLSIWNAFSLLWKAECFHYSKKSIESSKNIPYNDHRPR